MMSDVSSSDADLPFDVVIVDDRVTNRAIFSQLTNSVGSNIGVHAYGDPFEALDALSDRDVDLVITDFRMPGLDGAEFIRRVRGRAHGGEVPIVVVTAYADRQSRLQALEAGATDFLHSPVDPSEFRTRVRNLLKMSHQQRLIRSRAAELAVELDRSEASREQIVRESKELLAQVVDTVPAMISATDRTGRFVFVNAYQAELAGTRPEALAGNDPAPLFGQEQHERGRALDQRVFQTGAGLPGYEEEIRDHRGERRVLLTSKTPLRDGEGEIVSVLTTSLDITDRKRAEEHLVYLARHDPLTGLANRSYFYEQMQRALAQGRRGDRSFALHYVDLDRFKLVNDGLGHHVGDALLKVVAERLRRAVGDEGVIARLGGDEFGVLQADSPSWHAAAALAERIIAILDESCELDGTSLRTSASIGIAVYPRDGRTGDNLLRNADSAMYRAKIAGRKGYRFFGSDAYMKQIESVGLETDLRSAVIRNQLVLHYQPQVDLRTGRVVGAEALLRWSRPGWGLLAPSAFLPTAEDTGMILPISAWALQEACACAAAWMRELPAPVGVSVNLSPLQAREGDLVRTVREALAEAALPPALLTLELTEELLVEGDGPVIAALAELRTLGVRVCIDNFGAGHLARERLHRAPVDSLKIDQSFVQELGSDDGALATVRAAVELGRAYGLTVAAVGAETVLQLDMLRDAGCMIAQGFCLARPRPALEFAQWLQDGPHAVAVVPGVA